MPDFKEAYDDLVREYYEEGHLTYIESAIVDAIAALKKQIPIRAKIIKTNFNAYKSYCPECHKEQKHPSPFRRKNGWYCEKCGQKLHLGGDNE